MTPHFFTLHVHDYCVDARLRGRCGSIGVQPGGGAGGSGVPAGQGRGLRELVPHHSGLCEYGVCDVRCYAVLVCHVEVSVMTCDMCHVL